MAIDFASFDMPLTNSQIRRLRAIDCSGGNRVRAARAMVSMTQVQLAAALGVKQNTLSDLERRRSCSVTVETASKCAAFFGCSIEDLFPARQAVAS